MSMNAQPAWMSEFDQRLRASCRFRVGDVSLNTLWIYYFGIGGNADELVLDAYLNELLALAPGQMQLVDTAMRELSLNGWTEPAGQ